MHEDFWVHLVLVMVLITIAISVFSNSNIVGNVSKDWCQDADNGLNYGAKSISKDSQGNVFIDYCSSSNTLIEGFCNGTFVDVVEYPCACFDGICLLQNSGRKGFFR